MNLDNLGALKSKAVGWFELQWRGAATARKDDAWQYIRTLGWEDFDSDAWAELRTRALASWGEANTDRDRIRDGLKTSTLFGSALVTSIFGIAKANFDNVTVCSLLALTLAGLGTGIAFLASGTMTAPALPSVRVLMQDLAVNRPLIANDTLQLYAVIEEFRDSLNQVAQRDRQAKHFLFAAVMAILAEGFIVVLCHA